MVVRTRTFGTQSVYRESETQTEPYAPEYRVPDGVTPEVLNIVQICTSKGLPVTEAEVSTIERMRQKKFVLFISIYRFQIVRSQTSSAYR